MVDFVERFAEHQVERIRRAINAYRSKYRVGDVTLAKKIGKILGNNITHESTLKNIQRLRKGEPIRGTAFLNACVQFLEVTMTTPHDEELGLAMQRFLGNLLTYESLIENLAGDYAVLVSAESRPASPQSAPTECAPVFTFGSFSKSRPWIEGAALAVLSLSEGEGKGYAVAREKYYFPEDSEASALNLLQPSGACLPVTAQDFIIIMRDFIFSHMYMLKRDKKGFLGTLLLPSSYGVIYSMGPSKAPIPQYNVKLERVVLPTS